MLAGVAAAQLGVGGYRELPLLAGGVVPGRTVGHRSRERGLALPVGVVQGVVAGGQVALPGGIVAPAAPGGGASFGGGADGGVKTAREPTSEQKRTCGRDLRDAGSEPPSPPERRATRRRPACPNTLTAPTPQPISGHPFSQRRRSRSPRFGLSSASR
jgi:hypothetical protein